MIEEKLRELGAYLAASQDAAIEHWAVEFGELNLRVDRDQIANVLRYLRDEPRCQFAMLIDICGADYPGRPRRFDVVYHLLSLTLNQRIRVTVEADDSVPVPSVVGIFPSANWYEREAFDLYGVLFSGHPDLRRLLTDYGFQGHPLRKDFPLTGFVEVRYSEEQKRVIYEPVKLQQEFRNFDFLSPWEGADYNLPGDEKASQGPTT